MDTTTPTTNTCDCTGKKCGCGCHKVGAILIILFGLLFLLGTTGVLSASLVNMVWPILVIIAGVVKLGKGNCKCCSK